MSGCETWSLTLRDEHKMRVCENTILKRRYGHKEELKTKKLIKSHD
jgi:hypothetical protein